MSVSSLPKIVVSNLESEKNSLLPRLLTTNHKRRSGALKSLSKRTSRTSRTARTVRIARTTRTSKALSTPTIPKITSGRHTIEKNTQANTIYIPKTISIPSRRNRKKCSLRLVPMEPLSRTTSVPYRHIPRISKSSKRRAQSAKTLTPLKECRKNDTKWNSLLAISLQVSRADTSEEIISIIVSQVPKLLVCNFCTVFFVDDVLTPPQLYVRKSSIQHQHRTTNFSDWILGQSTKQKLPFRKDRKKIYFPITKRLAGAAYMTEKTIIVKDAHKDPRFDKAMDVNTGYRTRSVLCVPMFDRSQNTIIGVVQVSNKNSLYIGGFTQEDRNMLEHLTITVAKSILKSRLFSKMLNVRQRQDALLKIAHTIAKPMPQKKLFHYIVSQAQELIECERCTLFLLSDDHTRLYTSYDMSCGPGAPVPIDSIRTDVAFFSVDSGIVGHVAKTGQTLNIPDAYAHPNFNPEMDKKTGFRTRNILCVPITDDQGDILGVVQAINKVNKSNFHKEDEDFLREFSILTGSAIRNNKVFKQSERALGLAHSEVKRLQLMLRISKHLFEDAQLDNVNTYIAQQLKQILHVDYSIFYLVNTAQKVFYARENHFAKFPFNQGIAGIVSATGETILIQEKAYADKRFSVVVDQQLHRSPSSILCCPVKRRTLQGEDVLAVILTCHEKEQNKFSSDDVSVLEALCANAALTIVNSKELTSSIDKLEGTKTVKGDSLVHVNDRNFDASAVAYLKKKGMQVTSWDSHMYTMAQIEILEVIGVGSFGKVFKGKCKTNNSTQIIAVKKLHHALSHSQVNAFCNECTLMCQLKHPNIVRYVGAVAETDDMCILTEFCPKGSLASILKSSCHIDRQQMYGFALDAARGMNYLHAHNPIVLHRDLKTDNLLLDATWRVKVCDFGCTRFGSSRRMTRCVGTPKYLAPELMKGKPFTVKADVYAFGIILWEILSRERAFASMNAFSVSLAVLNNDFRPTILDSFKDDPMVMTMKNCWDTKPDARPSFAIIQQELDRITKLKKSKKTDREPAI